MTKKTAILFGSEAVAALHEVLDNSKSGSSGVFLLTDHNTHKYCLPQLKLLLGFCDAGWINISIPAGESHKTLETAAAIWQELTDHKAGRDAVLICLGGGVVTDIGGFAASCYKRGIRCIHIPTTLLAMNDAAIGGKTGIDFNFLKNHIGTFYLPEKVLILPEFLSTLPSGQLQSGWGEVTKYGFIASPALLQINPETISSAEAWHQLISECVSIKVRVTDLDPLETGLRKILNFGHTIGHAFESFALENNIELFHGQAVASGILVELNLSQKIFNLEKSVISQYIESLKQNFEPFKFSVSAIDDLIHRMGQDKKNQGISLRFVLLETIGKPIYDVEVQIDMIKEALLFYLAQINDESND